LGFLAAGQVAAVLGVALGAIVGYSGEQSKLDAGRATNKTGFNPTEELGAMAPLGYWDPAGIMKLSLDGEYYDWQWKDEDTFQYYRTAELKHGRLSMVALVGMLTSAFVRFPGSPFESASDGLGVAGSSAAGGVGIIFLLAAFIELETGDGKFEDPANLGGSGWLYLGKDYDNYSDDLRTKELAHGRLAMSTVFTLWLFEYGAGISPTTLIQNPNPQYVGVGLVVLVTFWANYLGLSDPTPTASVSEAKAALPAGSEAKAALPTGSEVKAALPESPTGGSVVRKDGDKYRFVTA